MRIVFMGTPDFAVCSLNALVEGGYEVVAVVTQPDRAKGRGNKLAFPEVKTRALELNLPVYQPDSVKTEEFLELLSSYQPDLIIAVAYGRILPKAVLELPKYGCWNVHASLLPAYRGAAPIQRAVLDGCTETGVTIMQLDEGMDTGDILLQSSMTITPEDTSGTMFDKLGIAGGKLLVEALEQLKNGSIHPVKQDSDKATHAAMLQREEEVIDWAKPAEHIFNQIRGMAPAPGAYTIWKEQRVKIWKANLNSLHTSERPGTVVQLGKESILVQTGKGCLEITELQPAGKKAMNAKAYCNGGGPKQKEVFGE